MSLSAGHIPALQRETSISLLCPGPKCRGEANSRCITHECLHVYMYMVYMYFRRQFEAVPAYVTAVAQNMGILDNACEERA